MVALPSIREVRAFLILPLYVHDEYAAGDIAYVMADGSAYFERLRAASDLYHMHRISTIYVLDEQRSAGYNFVKRRSEAATERAIAYLDLFGVPKEAIHAVIAEDSIMGSLSEAVAVSQSLSEDVKQIVVVTSAPHTRRSRLCFQRSLPPDIKIKTYSATIPKNSAELQAPIFHEYIKLIVYYFVA